MKLRQLATSCKNDLIDIYKHALEAVKPDYLVQKNLCIKGDRLIVSGSKEYDLFDAGIHVIGGGKCVLGMARGIAELLCQSKVSQEQLSHGCLSLPITVKPSFMKDCVTQDLLRAINVQCYFGANNNLPDESSIDATNYILSSISAACQHDRDNNLVPLFIVVLSGGGSACLTSPRHLNLDQKVKLIEQLVQKGADIIELNQVRSHFSAVKGGELARHILRSHPDARILSLILSDVIGDPLETIASGPTFVASANKISAQEVLEKYGLFNPELHKLDPPRNDVGQIGKINPVHKIIGNNEIAVKAAVRRAEALGYDVYSLGNNLQGSTREVVDKFLQFVRHLEYKYKIIVIGGGETTVKKLDGESWGLGGRVQEMALDYMISQLSSNSKMVDFLFAGSTDGQDGPTEVGACFASYYEWLNTKAFSLQEVYEAKKSHDAYNFWSAKMPNWLVKSGATGTNVMDIYFHLIAR